MNKMTFLKRAGFLLLIWLLLWCNKSPDSLEQTIETKRLALQGRLDSLTFEIERWEHNFDMAKSKESISFYDSEIKTKENLLSSLREERKKNKKRHKLLSDEINKLDRKLNNDLWVNKYNEKKIPYEKIFSEIETLKLQLITMQKANNFDENSVNFITNTLTLPSKKNILGEGQTSIAAIDSTISLKEKVSELLKIINNFVTDKRKEEIYKELNNEVENEKKEIIAKREKKEKNLEELQNDIESLDKKIRELNNNIKKLKEEKQSEIESSKEMIENSKSEILSYLEKLKAVYNQYILIEFDSLTKISPSYEEKKKLFLSLEKEIMKAIKNGDISYVKTILVMMRKQLEDLIKMNLSAHRKEYFFKNIYMGQPFMLHFKLNKFNKYEEKRQYRNFRETFIKQMAILKDFVKFFPNTKVYIDGHADSLEFRSVTGKQKNRKATIEFYKNMELSKNRALFIKGRFHGIVPDSNLIVDYYSRHVSQEPLDPETKNPKLSQKNGNKLTDRRVEVRVIRPLEQGEELPENINRYFRFKDSLKIQYASSKEKYFYREEGFWVEYNYQKNNFPEISIRYMSEVYRIFLKDETFADLMRKRDIIKEAGDCFPKYFTSFELGSQVKFLFESKKIGSYRININQGGKKTLNDIQNTEFKKYLQRLKREKR